MHTGNKNEWVSQYARIHAIREMETRRKARLENQALVGKRSFKKEVRKRQWRRRRAKFPMSLIDDTINFIGNTTKHRVENLCAIGNKKANRAPTKQSPSGRQP